jgi:hypothetical protein
METEMSVILALLFFLGFASAVVNFTQMSKAKAKIIVKNNLKNQ